MANSKIYEQGTVLPGGGTSQSFLNPSLPRMKGVGDVVSESLGVPKERPNFWSVPNVSQFPVSNNVQSNDIGYVNKGDATNSVMDYILSGQNDESRYRRENESKKRLLLLTDALRHIGNLYYTTRGAYPQNLGSSVQSQEDRYQNEKLQRQRDRNLVVQQALDAAKQRADEEYKNSLLGQKQAALDNKAALDALNFNFKLQQQKDLSDYRKRQGDLSELKMRETERHNRELEKNSRNSNALGWANHNLSAQRLKNTDMKDMIPMNHFQDGKSVYISKKWANSPQGRGVITALYNKLKSSKARNSHGQLVNAITPVGKRVDEEFVEKQNPTVNEMLTVLSSQANKYGDYMDFISEFGYDPNNVSYHKKPGIKYTKVGPRGKSEDEEFESYKRK